jgi:succinyl-CoA synthetase alpha subunit
VEGKEDTANEKIARLAEAGISVAERIEDIPEMIREQIAQRTGGAAPAGEGSRAR